MLVGICGVYTLAAVPVYVFALVFGGERCST